MAEGEGNTSVASPKTPLPPPEQSQAESAKEEGVREAVGEAKNGGEVGGAGEESVGLKEKETVAASDGGGKDDNIDNNNNNNNHPMGEAEGGENKDEGKMKAKTKPKQPKPKPKPGHHKACPQLWSGVFEEPSKALKNSNKKQQTIGDIKVRNRFARTHVCICMRVRVLLVC